MFRLRVEQIDQAKQGGRQNKLWALGHAADPLTHVQPRKGLLPSVKSAILHPKFGLYRTLLADFVASAALFCRASPLGTCRAPDLEAV